MSLSPFLIYGEYMYGSEYDAERTCAIHFCCMMFQRGEMPLPLRSGGIFNLAWICTEQFLEVLLYPPEAWCTLESIVYVMISFYWKRSSACWP